MIKKGYKRVFVANNNRLVSTYANCHENDPNCIGVEYKIGEFVSTKEKTLPLFVYSSLETVPVQTCTVYKLFECEYEPSEFQVKYFGAATTLQEEILHQATATEAPPENWYENVVFANKVKLIKEISIDDILNL